MVLVVREDVMGESLVRTAASVGHSRDRGLRRDEDFETWTLSPHVEELQEEGIILVSSRVNWCCKCCNDRCDTSFVRLVIIRVARPTGRA